MIIAKISTIAALHVSLSDSIWLWVSLIMPSWKFSQMHVTNQNAFMEK